MIKNNSTDKLQALLRHYLGLALIKYLVVGSTAFVAEYVSFYVMYTFLKVPLYVANTVSFGIGLLTSFLLNRLWTFAYKEYKKRASQQFSFYFALSAINLLLTNVLVAYFKYVGIQPKYGKLIAMVVTSSWNFILFKKLIFIHKSTSATDDSTKH